MKTSNDELQILCSNVMELRKKHGLSQRAMAKVMGISPQTLAVIEKGMIPPHLGVKAVFQLAAYFKIPVFRLFSFLKTKPGRSREEASKQLPGFE